MRKIDVLEVACTSIKLTWDPAPSKPHKTVGYRISVMRVGKEGYLPIVEDTGSADCNFSAIELEPGTEYR